MIKLCGKSIVYPLKLIFEASLQGVEFPDYWKKANVVPVHRKESKNLVKNQRPISLLPIFGKIFERVIFKDVFNYFHKNELFTKFQSYFFTRQFLHFSYYLLFMISTLLLTAILHRMLGIYFLDISKAFDKVWYQGFLFKLKTYCVKLLNFLETIFTSAIKKSFLMVKFLLGN